MKIGLYSRSIFVRARHNAAFLGSISGRFEYSLDGLIFYQVNVFDEWCLGAFRPILVVFPLSAIDQSVQITVRI